MPPTLTPTELAALATWQDADAQRRAEIAARVPSVEDLELIAVGWTPCTIEPDRVLVSPCLETESPVDRRSDFAKLATDWGMQ